MDGPQVDEFDGAAGDPVAIVVSWRRMKRCDGRRDLIARLRAG